MVSPIDKVTRPLRRITRSLILRNGQEAVLPATPSDTNTDAKELDEYYTYKVKKTVKSCRYAFENDGLVSGLIWNNSFTANTSFSITYSQEDQDIPNIEEAKQHIEEKCKEWQLKDRITGWLVKWQRDGNSFTHKVVENNTIYLNELAYNGETDDFEQIRNPLTGDILGYKQKYRYFKDYKNWKSQDFNSLKNGSNYEDMEVSFESDEIIHGRLFEEDGNGVSPLMGILDTIYDKWSYEKYKNSVAHKTGNVAVVTVGSSDVYTDSVPNSYLTRVLENLENREDKDAIVVPYGTSIETLGGNYNLPDINGYLKGCIDEIYIKLQTPQTLFSSSNSNRSTIEVQTDSDTGYGVYLKYMRDKVKYLLEPQLIDAELSLNPDFADCVGHIHITFISGAEEKVLRREDIDKFLFDEDEATDKDMQKVMDLMTDEESNKPVPNEERQSDNNDDTGDEEGIPPKPDDKSSVESGGGEKETTNPIKDYKKDDGKNNKKKRKKRRKSKNRKWKVR